MRRLTILTLVLALFVPAAPAASQGPGYKLVVNPQNATPALTRSDVTRLFLKKITEWPDGKPVQVVDQERTAPVRQAFSNGVHQKDADAIAAHWQVLVFSGRETPPRILRTDEDVLAFVRQNPGAIGYVSENAPVDGVRVVTVKK